MTRSTEDLIKAMTAYAVMDRSWHTDEMEVYKNLLLEGANELKRLLIERGENHARPED